MKCKLCGSKFEQVNPWEHVCPQCEEDAEAVPGQPDPTDLTMTRAREWPKEDK